MRKVPSLFLFRQADVAGLWAAICGRNRNRGPGDDAAAKDPIDSFNFLLPPFLSSLSAQCDLCSGFAKDEAMATVANSQPAFEQRLEELGIAHLLPEFKKKGWHTFGNFGYAISSPEVSKNKTEFEAEILKPLLGSDLLLAPQIRLLFTQSYIIATAELEQYGSAKSREPIELHPAERDSRRNALEKKLTGFDVRGLHEPSAVVRRSGLHAPTAVCVGSEGSDNSDPAVRVCAAGEFLSDRPSIVGVEPCVSLPSLVDPEVACDPVRVRAAAVPDADACAVPAPNTDDAGPLRVHDVVVAAECRVSAGVSPQGSDSPSTEPSLLILRPKSLQQLAMMICSLPARSSIWAALAPFVWKSLEEAAG